MTLALASPTAAQAVFQRGFVTCFGGPERLADVVRKAGITTDR